MEMSNHRIDALVTDRLVGLYSIKKAKLDFRTAGAPLYRENMGIAAKKGNDKLIKAVNKALADMKADGTYAKISSKWFGRDVSKDE